MQKEYDNLNISSRLSNSNDSFIEIKDWLGVVGHWAEDITLRIIGGIPSNFYAKSLVYTENNIIPDDGVDKLFDYMNTADESNVTWFIIWLLKAVPLTTSHLMLPRTATEMHCSTIKRIL